MLRPVRLRFVGGAAGDVKPRAAGYGLAGRKSNETAIGAFRFGACRVCHRVGAGFLASRHGRAHAGDLRRRDPVGIGSSGDRSRPSGGCRCGRVPRGCTSLGIGIGSCVRTGDDGRRCSSPAWHGGAGGGESCRTDRARAWRTDGDARKYVGGGGRGSVRDCGRDPRLRPR